MRIMALVLTATLVSGGCVNYRASQGVAIIGGLGLIGAAVASVIRKGPTPDNDIDLGGMFIAFTAMASATVGVSGLLGMLIHGRPSSQRSAAAREAAARSAEATRQEREALVRADQERAEAQARASAIRGRVLELMKEARAAAQANDCAVVRERGISIRALDSEFHATVFVHDVALQGCLDAAPTQPAPVQAPTETPTPTAP